MTLEELIQQKKGVIRITGRTHIESVINIEYVAHIYEQENKLYLIVKNKHDTFVLTSSAPSIGVASLFTILLCSKPSLNNATARLFHGQIEALKNRLNFLKKVIPRLNNRTMYERAKEEYQTILDTIEKIDNLK